MTMKQLPDELVRTQKKIDTVAGEFALSFFPVVFEMVDYRQMNALAAYGGFPTRYPHWRHGMEYHQLSKSYEYGLHRIYEMVINNDPTYAYLLEGNTMLDQKMVMAHVYGHADFFKNNVYFAHTNRKIVDAMAWVCPGRECIEEVDGTLLRSDGIHFTPGRAAERVAR